jgi:hypothetical protein
MAGAIKKDMVKDLFKKMPSLVFIHFNPPLTRKSF